MIEASAHKYTSALASKNGGAASVDGCQCVRQSAKNGGQNWKQFQNIAGQIWGYPQKIAGQIWGFPKKIFRDRPSILLGILQALFRGPLGPFEALLEGPANNIWGVFPGGLAPLAPTLEAILIHANLHWRQDCRVSMEYTKHIWTPYSWCVKPFDVEHERYMCYDCCYIKKIHSKQIQLSKHIQVCFSIENCKNSRPHSTNHKKKCLVGNDHCDVRQGWHAKMG